MNSTHIPGKVFYCCALLLFLSSCKKKETPITDPVTEQQPVLPEQPFPYSVSYPKHIADVLLTDDNTPPGNPITDEGATLGRVLFYDPSLSFNSTISCASCHKQAESFSDNRAVSTGFTGQSGTRHSMPLLNVRFYRSGKMFWDERAATLEQQVLLPIQDHAEMGSTLSLIVERVRSKTYYPALFTKAFGSPDIDTVRIARALAQFVRSIVPYQSHYDRVQQGIESFTALEASGNTLFNTAPPAVAGAPPPAACAGCHKPPMFLTSDPARPFSLPDPDDAGINNQRRFKSVSLRNIALRSSLFHNGSVSSLQDMFTRGAPGTTPIPAHTIRPQDMVALTAFLQTLNDQSILSEERFSDPFQ